MDVEQIDLNHIKRAVFELVWKEDGRVTLFINKHDSRVFPQPGPGILSSGSKNDRHLKAERDGISGTISVRWRSESGGISSTASEGIPPVEVFLPWECLAGISLGNPNAPVFAGVWALWEGFTSDNDVEVPTKQMC